MRDRPRARARRRLRRTRSSGSSASPAIVAIVERAAGRAVGVTVEGIAVELVARADPSASGRSSLRATGSPAYVASLGALPDAPDEEGVYAQLGLPWCPPELREAPLRARAAAPRRARRHPRRPALPHDLVGREGIRRGDGARGARARLRVPRDLRPHAERARRARASTPTRCARRPRRSPPSTSGRAVPGPARHGVRHPQRRHARPARRRARRARLGAAVACTRASARSATG